MFNKVEIQQGRRLVTAYEYTLFAFTTPKGTFTLVGSDADGTDTFKCLETREYHEWNRSHVYEWFIQGKIAPVNESKTLDWYNNHTNKNNRLQRLKSSRKK